MEVNYTQVDIIDWLFETKISRSKILGIGGIKILGKIPINK